MIENGEQLGFGQLDLWDRHAKDEARDSEWKELTSDAYLKYIAGYLVNGLSGGAPAEHELTTETDWRGEMKRHLKERGTIGGRGSMIINYVIDKQRAEQNGGA